MSLEARFATALERMLAGQIPDRLAVAVSGGGDSLALLGLACDWAEGRGCDIHALTVDHGLRPEAADEALIVAREAVRMGAQHRTLKWRQWDGKGNLQAAAREARYRLMRGYCTDHGIKAILLGHTQDDQAETVLMRLARGSGVDGLAAMPEGRYGTDDILRPLLAEPRSDLRIWLTRQGMRWVEDPTNDDPRYDRVRARRLLTQLAPFGLDASRLAETAAAMARARVALGARAAELADAIVTDRRGIVLFDRDRLAAVEEETRLRLVAHGLACLSGAPYKPRLATLTATLDRALQGRGGTLQGCRLIPWRDRLVMAREAKAVERQEIPADGTAFWDGRWRISLPDVPGATIRVLGEEGVAMIDRSGSLPHAALLSFPGVWLGPTLIAAPDLWNAELLVCEYAASAVFHASVNSR
ncbi:tRNA lysidine(34) synthetase TilS [Nioella nitratireducens]|uniref:tRNA lysidine(34) synthetase TilS n=1 Tax=Nioella nitratireducens TaxID=1287720 RepID=UPI000A0643E5|nr:tRNA lysidine(34) synthetase TilS [Nioella nitratireducens]